MLNLGDYFSSFLRFFYTPDLSLLCTYVDGLKGSRTRPDAQALSRNQDVHGADGTQWMKNDFWNVRAHYSMLDCLGNPPPRGAHGGGQEVVSSLWRKSLYRKPTGPAHCSPPCQVQIANPLYLENKNISWEQR